MDIHFSVVCHDSDVTSNTNRLIHNGLSYYCCQRWRCPDMKEANRQEAFIGRVANGCYVMRWLQGIGNRADIYA